MSLFYSMATMLGNPNVAFAVVMPTQPRAIPLAMITMRKSTHGFSILSFKSMGLRLAALWAPLLMYGHFFKQSNVLKTQIIKQCLQTFEFQARVGYPLHKASERILEGLMQLCLKRLYNSGAPAARRAAKRSPILNTGKQRKPMS